MPDIFNASQHSQPSDTSANNLPPEPEDDPKAEAAVQSKVDDQLALFQQAHPAKGPLAAFLAKPANTFFDSQTHQEKILLMLRQHPVTQIKWVVLAIILLVMPIFFHFIPMIELLPSRFQEAVYLGWYFLVMGFILETFLDWFFNVSIVTDERIIDVEFVSLLFKHISYTQIERIEDVTATTSGAIGSIFDYGNVLIQTAGATDQFTFENVPEPSEVAEFINEMLVIEERERELPRI